MFFIMRDLLLVTAYGRIGVFDSMMNIFWILLY